jgi:hypothetical protein
MSCDELYDKIFKRAYRRSFVDCRHLKAIAVYDSYATMLANRTKTMQYCKSGWSDAARDGCKMTGLHPCFYYNHHVEMVTFDDVMDECRLR